MSNSSKIIHIVSEISLKNFSICSFINFLNNHSKQKQIIISNKIDNKHLINNKKFKKLTFESFFFNFKKILYLIKKYHKKKFVFHIHGFWTWLQILFLVVLLYKNYPVVIHSHGMILYPAIYSGNKIKYILKLFLLKLLKWLCSYKKIYFIAITKQEQKQIKYFFPNNYVRLVPNPIPFQNPTEQKKINFKKKIFVFFGRIHPHKNIDLIIKSFLQANLPENCFLEIYGIKDDMKYFKKLKKLISKNNKIKIFDPIFFNKKQKKMKNSWVNVLLSKSEVLSFSLLESGLCGLPTLVNKDLELPYKDNFTLKTKESIRSTSIALQKISKWSIIKRIQLKKKLINYYNNYKNRINNASKNNIYNIYDKVKKINNAKLSKLINTLNFLGSTFLYSTNFFLPSLIFILFFLFNYRIVSSEIAIVSSVIISLTQILSANQRNLIIANHDLDRIPKLFLYRFYISCLIILISLFSFDRIENIQDKKILISIVVIICLQWIFEIIIAKLELKKNNTKIYIYLILYIIFTFLIIFGVISNNIKLFYFFLNAFIFIKLWICLIYYMKFLNINITLHKFDIFENIISYPFLSSLFLILSGLVWKIGIYNLFDKAVSSVFFTTFAFGSLFGTFFSLITGPSYLHNKIKLNKKIKFLFIFLFILILILFIDYNFYSKVAFQYLQIYLKYDELYYLSLINSILGSFFMTLAMYYRLVGIFTKGIYQLKVFKIDVAVSVLIMILLLPLNLFFGSKGVSFLFLISSIICLFFYYNLLFNKLFKLFKL